MPWCTNYLQRLNEARQYVSDQKSDFMSALNNCQISCNVEEKSDQLSDPNLVMDIRHSMAKTNGALSFVFPSKEEFQTNAFKKLRDENHKKLLNEKNKKLVEMEIFKLKKLLSTYETVREINKEKVYIKALKAARCKQFVKPKSNFSLGTMKEMNKMLCNANKSLGCKVNINEKQVEEEPTTPVSSKKGSLVDEVVAKKECSWCSQTESFMEELLDKFFQSPNEGKPVTVNEIPNTSNLELEANKEVSFLPDYELNSDDEKNEAKVQMYRSQNILIKAWKSWRMYTIICKRRKIEKITHESKINNFIAQLEQVKNNTQNKNERKNKIINCQPKISVSRKLESAVARHKLKQKEVAVIKKNENDRKLEKLEEDLKVSQNECHERLTAIKMRKEKEKLFKVINTQLPKEKRKIIPNPKFLLRMEKRKQERDIRRKQILERKQRLEEERKVVLERMEEEKKMIQEEEKRRKQVEIKQKKEEDKKRKELHRLRVIQAQRHYEASLLQKYGFIPWRLFVKSHQLQLHNALQFAKTKLLSKVLKDWRSNVKQLRKDKEDKAHEFFRILYLKKYLIAWKNVWRERMEQIQVAADWHDFKLLDKHFTEWFRFTQHSYLLFLDKSHLAQLHYDKTLKKRFLKFWKLYPTFKKREIAKEIRKQIWRQKIQQILPDFQPTNVMIDS